MLAVFSFKHLLQIRSLSHDKTRSLCKVWFKQKHVIGHGSKKRVLIFRFWTSKHMFHFEFIDATKRHQHNMYKQFFYDSLNLFTSSKSRVCYISRSNITNKYVDCHSFPPCLRLCLVHFAKRDKDPQNWAFEDRKQRRKNCLPRWRGSYLTVLFVGQKGGNGVLFCSTCWKSNLFSDVLLKQLF